MRVPLSWLREYVEVELTPEALAERLTLLGMEVQGIERIGADWQSVVVGELLEVMPHPHAAKLLLTRVSTAADGPALSIVCGATNIAVGQRVPVALPGAVLPGGRRIDVAPKAGVESHGMLCSGDELRLTADAEGILILPADAPLGKPLAELYGDTVLDVDVKPNRGDALSLVGLAREVAAITGGTLRWPDMVPPERGDATSDHVRLEVRDILRCPRFVARYLDGVTVGPSPFQVQLRLGAAGMRPISNVVDATNYVMLELGKPIHVYDATAVAEGHLIVRAANPGEVLETLDHVSRRLDRETLVIADPAQVLGIAGVMGGASSEVGDGTTSVIVESAIFDPVSIRRTGQRFALRSEASLRFEKGIEWRLARLGADRATALVAAWSGGRPALGVVDTDAIDPPPARVSFRPARVERLLGTKVPVAEQRELLARVEVRTEEATSTDAITVTVDGPTIPADGRSNGQPAALVAVVPSHRRDIAIEEIARVRGYDTVPSKLPETPAPPYRADARGLTNTIRDLLSGRGLDEVVTNVLIAPADHERLGIDPQGTITVANPVSHDHSVLRTSLLPGLSRVLVANERQRRLDLAIFELGSIHRYSADGTPEQSQELGILLAGEWQPGSWAQPGRSADAADAKGILEWLCDRAAHAHIRWEPTTPSVGVEHPGRTAAALVETAEGRRLEIGRAGELDPRYLAAIGARAEQVAFAGLSMAALARIVPERIRAKPIPRVPATERDLAVVLDEDHPAGQVQAIIREAGGKLLRDVALFDRYQGPPLGSDEVSLAYRIRLQATERTLTDAEVDQLMERVISALRERAGARIRR
jgi:phenylalanyl-tRNA synthetase beta chain